MQKDQISFALATIATSDGAAAAIVANGRVTEIASLTGRQQDRSVLNIVSDWEANLTRLDAFATQVADRGKPLRGVTLLAPIPDPGGIFCAGANYSDHAAEMAARLGHPAPPDPHTLGLRSWHFLVTRHCLTGPKDPVALHPRGNKIDWEAELAVVIGKKAFQVSEDNALDYVLGYTIANDLSARDLARRDSLPDGSSFKQDWVSHKNWDGSCPMGPWITLKRDVPDPHDLAISLTVNGVLKQKSNSSQMIFDIREQIADLTSNFTLWPGDVILTGTPAGVGAGRGEFLKKGDVVRVQIERLGELVTTII